ncbi:terminase large subunit [Arcobacter arenosus]|uniref:Terminase large subunit n=1 Tax=Arcobacter arenosus TaxID=2576037 RepID=A0A5R8Y4I8_9BACT|nr:terminase TerL endonuclease subunit [Arcobacter arenosus]TLP41047.1 terminase large subunit [Arcobacter arenosus]
MKNREFNEPKFYWELAKEYINKKTKELTNSEYYIDEKLAYKCVRFSSMLKHTSGEFAGVNFQFQVWQIESIIDIFGTKYKSGMFKDLRRYQKALFFMPKKNGKSEFAGVLHAIMFFIDHEKAKEQYSIATEAEQAKIIHKVFLTMIKQEPDLLGLVKSTVKPPRITKEDGAFEDEFQSLTSSADTKDGLRPSFLTVDEGHAHKTIDLYQIMSDGLAGRNEPLEIHLSTAGYNMQGFFFRLIYTYAKKVKKGIIKDDRFYPVLFEPSEEDLKNDDFWKDREIWKKANPNLGVSPTYSYMEGKISLANESEEALIAFKTKHLNVWCDKPMTWIKSNVWTRGQEKIGFTKLKELKTKIAYGGLDLASTTDIAALVLIFPTESGYMDILTRFWIPKDNLRERANRDKVPYLDWEKQGLITATDGNIIDYNVIKKDIQRYCEFFNIKLLAYDRWNSSQLITDLNNEEITTLVPFGQGFASMSAPTKQIEVLALQDNLNHGNNEVLNWMCSNVVLKRDPSDNIKIDKDKSIEKVDGMVALAEAVGVYLTDKKEEEEINPYEDRGFRFI